MYVKLRGEVSGSVMSLLVECVQLYIDNAAWEADPIPNMAAGAAAAPKRGQGVHAATMTNERELSSFYIIYTIYIYYKL